jgi:hypothetical protein
MCDVNLEARSRNYCCSGKTYFCVCVCVCACTIAGVCLRACSLTNSECNAHAPYCHLRPLWLHHIF